MAEVVVRTNSGEELCSWVIEPAEDLDFETVLPGLYQALSAAFDIEAQAQIHRSNPATLTHTQPATQQNERKS
jgi:hypothetical protein